MNTRHRRIYAGAGAAVLVLAMVSVVALPDGLWSESSAGGTEDRAGREGMATPGMKLQESDTGGGGMADMQMGGGGTDGTIRLTAGQVATFGITFGAVDVRPLEKTIRAVGLVGFDETRMTSVAPKFGGWVERLHVNFTGQPVRRGQPLLDVYSPELVTAQEELLLAARMVEDLGGSRLEDVAAGASDLLESARRRLRYWDVSDEQIERLLRTGEVRKTLTLHAPVSGVVVEKDVVEGQAYEAGKSLYMIADLSEVWVTAEVFEADAALMREGMRAEITVAALPGRTFSGRVEYVYPTLDGRTRSMEARIALENPGMELKPGMYATVRFASRVGEVLTVPRSAVLHSGERAVAFVDMGGGALMPHELKLGLQGEDYVEVLSGLEPGQRVVTAALFLLNSEANLAEVMRAMMAQMNMTDAQAMDMGGMDMGGRRSMEGMEMGGQGTAPPPPDSSGGR